ncbi:hypothetical protein CsatB_026417 [Cannabis sativa]
MRTEAEALAPAPLDDSPIVPYNPYVRGCFDSDSLTNHNNNRNPRGHSLHTNSSKANNGGRLSNGFDHHKAQFVRDLELEGFSALQDFRTTDARTVAPNGSDTASYGRSKLLGFPNHSLPREKIVVAVDVDEVLANFVSALNRFIADCYSSNHSVSEYHVYEFFKAPEMPCQHDLFMDQGAAFSGQAGRASAIETGTKLYISILKYGVSNEDIKHDHHMIVVAFIASYLSSLLRVCYYREDGAAPVPVETPAPVVAPGEPMDLMTTLQLVLRKALNTEIIFVGMKGSEDGRDIKINNIRSSIVINVDERSFSIVIHPMEGSPFGGNGCVVLGFIFGCTCPQ